MPDQRSSIDEQVVKMSFDNSNFDSNINDSITALNNLDTKLGLLNKEDFAGLKSSVDSLAQTFSVKGQVMLGVFASLGKKIVDIGVQLKNKLFAGIEDGLGEYKMIIDSTQTIYQNVKKSGVSLEQVYSALDELNEYADKTIYNFSEMTRMIGMFTSAGVSLKKSVSTIKGLANAAALVGANSERAQIAWQAVSRAMSSGQFTNVVWRSLELSNIAGEQFNKVITTVAKANNVVGKSGKNIDEMIEKYGSLRLTLSEGWLDKNIFAEAMSIMAGEIDETALLQKGYTEEQVRELREIADAAEAAATQVKTFQQLIETTKEAIGSGWASSFRILLGDLEQAKKTFTRISIVVNDFIDNNANIRNKLFKQIMDGEKNSNDSLVKGLKTGRENFEQTIENMLAVVKTFLKAVKTGFLNIFPIDRLSAAAQKVLDIAQKFTRALVLNNEELNKQEGFTAWDTESVVNISNAIKDLIRFFRGLASAVDIAWQAFSQPIKAIIQRIPFLNNFFENTNSGLLSILNKLGNFGDKITAVRNALKDTKVIENIVGYFLDNIEEIGEKFPILGVLLSIFKNIKKALTGIRDAFRQLDIKPLSAIFGVFKFVVEGLSKALNFVFSLLKNVRNSIDWSFLEGPKNAIIGFIKKLSDYGRGLITFEELTGKIGEAFNKLFDAIAGLFGKNKIKKGTGEIQKSFTNFGDKVTTLSTKIKKIGEDVKKFLAPIADYIKNADWSLEGIVKKVTALAGGIGAAAFGISRLSITLGKRKLIDNLNDLLTSGIDVVKAYQKQIESKMILNIAIAIGILAAALVVLAFVPYDKLENGLVIFASFMSTIALTLTPVITALARFNESLLYTRKTLTRYDVLNNFVKQLGKFGKQIAKGINAKLIGQSFKDIAFSVFILVGAIAALVLLFKLDSSTVIKAFITITILMGSMVLAVTLLTIAINAFAKSTDKAKASVGTFAQFFKLSGIAAVLLSLAAAIAILVASLALLTHLDQDKMANSWLYMTSLIGLLGVIAVGVTYFTSKVKDFNKFKTVAASVAMGMAGIAVILLAMKPLVDSLSIATDGAWAAAIAIFTSVILQFTGMMALLLVVAKKIGGQTTIWEKLDRFMLEAALCITAIGVVIFTMGQLGEIPWSAVATIGILVVAMQSIISLLSLIAIVIANAKGTFANNFINIIEKISFSISATIVAIGAMAAGIGVLINALSNLNIKDSDANKASKSLIDKLGTIAKTIIKALPRLKAMFYSIGFAVGSMVTSFVMGMVDNITSTGETFLSIADKLVNLVIDILAKVVTLLESRKEDIARIIREAIDFIGAVITEIVNDIFKRNSDNKFSEDQILKFLGFSFTGAGVIGIATKFNTLSTALTNLKKPLDALKSFYSAFKTQAGGGLGDIFETFGAVEGLQYANMSLIQTIANLKGVKKFGDGAAKALNALTNSKKFKFDANANATLGETVAALFAIAVALQTVKGAAKGWGQLFHGEAQYFRSDVTDLYSFLDAFFTDSEYRSQIMIYGLAALGRILVQTVVAPIKMIASGVSWVITGALGAVEWFFGGITDLLSLAFPQFESFFDGFMDNMDMMTNTFKEQSAGLWDDAIGGIKGVFDFTLGDEWVDGAVQTSAEAGAQVASAYVDSYTSTMENSGDEMYRGAYSVVDNVKGGAMEALKPFKEVIGGMFAEADNYFIEMMQLDWDEHSPSKVTRDIYYNVMRGAVQGLNLGEKEYMAEISRINSVGRGIFLGEASATAEAWHSILSEKFGISEYVDKIRDMSFEFDTTDGLTKEVQLNQQIVELMIERQNEMEGMTKTQAQQYLQQVALDEGIQASVLDIGWAVKAAATYSADGETIYAKSIAQLDKDTTLYIEDVFGRQAEAMDMVVEDVNNKFNDVLHLAEDHKEEIVGKKREEVEEILAQEAIAAGMQEDSARDTAKMVAAALFEGKNINATISAEELATKINQYDAEYNAFVEMEKAKIQIANETQKVLEDLAKTGYQEQFDSTFKDHFQSEQEYAKWLATTAEGQQAAKLNKQLYDLQKQYTDLQLSQKNDISGLLGAAGMSAEDIGTWFDSKVDATVNALGRQKTKSRGLSNYIEDFFSGLGVKVPEVDLSSWNIGSDLNDSLDLSDDDISSAVDAAADLKDGLESQRADLTPTFDLDQLASDANKATGIVMSSLMAAQNASIGDYINKDSELNPFMKDRWQNVYNFTQNNYSPKALSRIDIYRQTQRQISMSRGF